MLDPSSLYESMMLYGHGGAFTGFDHYGDTKHAISEASSMGSFSQPTNFNDFDDESGNYYLRKSLTQRSEGNKWPAAGHNQQQQQTQPQSESQSTQNNSNRRSSSHSLVATKEQEALLDDVDDELPLKRVKRQISYSSGYEKGKPCHGFPLEINVRSRIKMDQLFPIHGNSQMKKCVKFR